MIPHRQLITHDPDNGRYGDCYRTCIASILNIESPALVPHFYGDDGVQIKQSRAWLSRRGLSLAHFYFDGTSPLDAIMDNSAALSPGSPLILSGLSALGCNHSVVVLDGQIACDPSGNGIVGPCTDGYWWIAVICAGLGYRP